MKNTRRNRKITLEVPEELISKALKTSKKNLTATVKQALQMLAATAAYDNLLNLEGRISCKVDLAKLRED